MASRPGRRYRRPVRGLSNSRLPPPRRAHRVCRHPLPQSPPCRRIDRHRPHWLGHVAAHGGLPRRSETRCRTRPIRVLGRVWRPDPICRMAPGRQSGVIHRRTGAFGPGPGHRSALIAGTDGYPHRPDNLSGIGFWPGPFAPVASEKALNPLFSLRFFYYPFVTGRPASRCPADNSCRPQSTADKSAGFLLSRRPRFGGLR